MAEGAQGKSLARIRALTAPVGIALSLVGLVLMLNGGNGMMQGWDDLARQAEALRRHTGADAIATTDYNTQGQLSFHLNTQTITPLHERQRYHWLPTAAPAGQSVLVLVQNRHERDLSLWLTDIAPAGQLSRGPSAKSGYRVYTGTVR